MYQGILSVCLSLLCMEDQPAIKVIAQTNKLNLHETLAPFNSLIVLFDTCLKFVAGIYSYLVPHPLTTSTN